MQRFLRLFAVVIAMAMMMSVSAVAQENAGEEQSYTDGLINISDDEHIFEPLKNKNDSLFEALALAYQNNPTIRAARAELLAVKEQLPQARAGFRPSIMAEADVTYTDTETEGQSFITSDGGNTSKSAGINLSQPLYRGGRTYAEVKQAQNIIAAQELYLSNVEQTILYNAAVAYMDVLRDEAILALNENNRDLVDRERDQAENRFTVGELTRTDVSQSQARLAAAVAGVITAGGDLKSAKAIYRQIIGSPPMALMAYPETNLDLPKTLEEALSIAKSNNRMVLQSKFIKQAAEHNVSTQRGVMLPEISAIGQLNKSFDPTDFIEEQDQYAIGIQASIPLYQAGTNISRVREAKKTVNQRAIEIIEAEAEARQLTIDSWEKLQTARAEVKARESQIEAARVAREGVQYEEQFGQRTTLDALDANQELLDAQVSLITAKRNEVVAQFALARNLGLLVPQKLGFTTINP